MKLTTIIRNILIIFGFVLTSCGNNVVPKPKAQLRLEYPKANYIDDNLELPFAFEKNILAKTIIVKELKASTKSYGVNVEYPSLKGTIFLTYKAIENNENNLWDFIKDAQKLPNKHMSKADGVLEEGFESSVKKVYGRFYEIEGDAASQSQFYVTDSLNHFLTGSLYFYAKPNYDSILPAANYLQKDIKRIMETVIWK